MTAEELNPDMLILGVLLFFILVGLIFGGISSDFDREEKLDG